MRKLLLLFSLLFASVVLFAQTKKVTTTSDKLVAKESIKLQNTTITAIDTAITSSSSNATIPTANAVRTYVMQSGSVGIPSLLNKSGKALRVQGVSGSETAVWKDTLPNFYYQDGVIQGNRIIDVNNKNLTFNNTNSVVINPNNSPLAGSGNFSVFLHNNANVSRPTERVTFRGGTAPTSRGLTMTMYDSTRVDATPILSVATFDNKGIVERHSLPQLLSSIGGGTVSGDGVLIKNNTAYLGGTLQDPAPLLNRKRIIRYSSDTCTLEFNRNGLGSSSYVPLRFKAQDGIEAGNGNYVNTKVEFENRDNDDMNTKIHSLRSRYEDFTVYSDSILLLRSKNTNIKVGEGFVDFWLKRQNAAVSQITFGKNVTGDGYARFFDWNNSRNDSGNPSSIASFNNLGFLERHPISELKTALDLKAKDVAFTPISSNSTYVAIDSNNVQGALNQVSRYLKNAAVNNITMCFQPYKPTESFGLGDCISFVMPSTLIGKKIVEIIVKTKDTGGGGIQLNVNCGGTNTITVPSGLDKFYSLIIPNGGITITTNELISASVISLYGSGPWKGLSVIFIFQ